MNRVTSPRQERALIVLDLNGVLLDRRDKRLRDRSPDGYVCKRPVYLRPHAHSFVEWLLQHFRVAVWTSACAVNAWRLVSLVFGPLEREVEFVWGQEQCFIRGRTEHGRPLFDKPLDLVWRQGRCRKDRTIMIDDSPDKLKRFPENCIHPPAYDAAHADEVLAPQSELRLQLLARRPDLDVQV